jgi:hypothetical protein
VVGIAHRQWLQKTSNFDWLRTSNTDCLLVFVWIHSSRPASLVYIDDLHRSGTCILKISRGEGGVIGPRDIDSLAGERHQRESHQFTLKF